MAQGASSIEDFVGTKPNSNDFRVPQLPLLAYYTDTYGFKRGVVEYDRKMEDWKNQLERAINERLSGKESVSPGNAG